MIRDGWVRCDQCHAMIQAEVVRRDFITAKEGLPPGWRPFAFHLCWVCSNRSDLRYSELWGWVTSSAPGASAPRDPPTHVGD